MAFYQVFLRDITGGVEVSAEGRIVTAAPVLEKAIGLPFTKFNAWVKGKGGEIFPVKERPDYHKQVIL